MKRKRDGRSAGAEAPDYRFGDQVVQRHARICTAVRLDDRRVA